MISSLLPAMIIFNLDYTLWPFYPDSFIHHPCHRRIRTGEIVDSDGKIIKCYPEVPEIFKKLNDAGIEIGITAISSKPRSTIRVMNLFGWDKYISFAELENEFEADQLVAIHNKSNVPYDKMIYFNDDIYIVEDAQELGIFSVHVRNRLGVTMKLLYDGVKAYQTKQTQKK